MALLKAEELCYHYRTKAQTVRAVDGVSLELERGGFYALTGRSGSGKSTLLSLLAGLETPMSGRITVNGN
ncbi:MAG: ATP-binding cassette domain-containing protein [Clostridia bacterium]|nr:ATP-binding cassette domain-containing protein [Clostridia bacterium]